MRWISTLALIAGCSKSPDGVQTDSAGPDIHSNDDSGDETGDTGVSDCTEDLPVTWESWGRDFFRTWCDGCHAESTPERNGAPESYIFDTESQIIEHRSILQWSVIEESRMPLGGGLPDDERHLLAYYLDCVIR